MPNDDATNAAMWNTAGQVATTAANVMSTSRWNKKTAKWNEQNRDLQRSWALQDWEMQNEYNAPKNVRQRMIEAGMNPALMYGAGVSGGASSPVRTSQQAQWNPKTPEYNLNVGSSIMTYLGVQKQVAELDQLKIQNRLLEEQITNKQADTGLKTVLAGLKGIDLQVAQKAMDLGLLDSNALSENQIQATRAELLRMSADQNQIMYAKNAEELTERISLIKQQQAKTDAERQQIIQNTENLKKSGILKQITIDGQQFLNSRFDAPALKIIMGLLDKL